MDETTNQNDPRARGVASGAGRRALVLLSGGIDSAACVHFLLAEGFIVDALFVDYGQLASRREFQAARSLTSHYEIALQTLCLSNADPLQPGEIIGRNMFLLSAAVLKDRSSSNVIAIGIHAGTNYFDCSPIFFDAISQVVASMTSGVTRISAPFLMWKKQEVVAYAKKVGVPINLTYSCEAADLACGRCASCKDREAFQC